MTAKQHTTTEITKTKRTFCRICEPACPLQVEFDGEGKACTLKPDPGHPLGGIPCNKGLGFLKVHHDPARLNWPQRRTNSKSEPAKFERVSWDDSLIEIADKIKQLQEQYGDDAVAVYGGNPIAFDSRAFGVSYALAQMLGSPHSFSAGSQDCNNKSVNHKAMYGAGVNFIPDLTNTDYFLCIAANPKASHWTWISVPNDGGQILKDIKARGGKVTFVNPRKIESSTVATGETLRIKPDTDVYFLAALSNEIDQLGGFDEAHLRRHGSNVDQYLAFIKNWNAEKVSAVTGLTAESIKQVAADMVAAKSAACYVSTGVNQGRQGTLCCWLSEMLNFATGNLGKVGGTIKAPGLMSPQPEPVVTREWESPDGTLPVVVPSLPAVLLPDLIEQGKIRALICLSGNPVLSIGGGERLRSALKQLELLACVDIMPSETTEIADYVLPATDWLEREDITCFPIFMSAQIIPNVQYTDAVCEPAEERRSDWWIVSRLLQYAGRPSPLDHPKHGNGFKLLDMGLAAYGLSIEKLKDMPYQTALIDPLPIDELYEKNILHKDNKIDCYPQPYTQYGLFERFEKIWAELAAEPDDTLKIISMRTAQMHNSWMANVAPLRQGSGSDNRLRICAQDATKHGVFDGDLVRLYNDHGDVNCRIEIREDVREGTVAMSHGFGHNHVSALNVASANPGVNCNQLMPIGSKTYEPLSNMSWLCGVPIKIERLEA